MHYFGTVAASFNALAGWIVDFGVASCDRFLPERGLSQRLGISLGKLRKAMTAPETEGAAEGYIEQGAFLRTPSSSGLNIESLVMRLTEITSLKAAMMVRLSIKPELAGHAMILATPGQLTEARILVDDMRSTASWTEYEHFNAGCMS